MKTTNQQTPLIDICLEFGTDQTQPLLCQLKADVTLNPLQIAKIKEEIGYKENTNEDMILKCDFAVEIGRQKECLEFFQRGFEMDDDQVMKSPLQKLFRRPKKSGKLQVIQSQGEITLLYDLYAKSFTDLTQQFNKYFKQDEQSQISIEMQFKGFNEVFKKAIIKVKMDYAQCKIVSKTIPLQKLVNTFKQNNQQLLGFMNMPILKLLFSMEQVKIRWKFQSIRRIVDFYLMALYNNEQQHQANRQNLIIKGLFNKQVKFYLIVSNRIAIQITFLYQNQGVLMRIIQVLQSFYNKLDSI